MGNQLLQKLTLLKRWSKILSGKTAVAIEQEIGKAFSTEKIAGYYNDLTGKVSDTTLLDDQGVPVAVIAGGDHRHFPIAIFQYALGSYDKFLLTQNQKYLTSFKSCIDWAIAHQREDGSWDAFSPIGSVKYTVSSMAQGEGASALLRGYVQYGDAKYLDSARKAIDYMLIPLDKGGVSIHENGHLYLEEYPQNPRRSVLNGWIFSLFGLFDLSLVDNSYTYYFQQSAKTLAEELDQYDTGYWSYYDLEHRIASPAYHKLHIALLSVMAQLSDLSIYAEYAEKFEKYQNSSVNKYHAIARKVIQKLSEKSDAVIVQ